MMLEQRIIEKEQLISRLNYDLTINKDESIENADRISQLEQQIWKLRQENAQMTEDFHKIDMEKVEKDRIVSQQKYELSQARDQIQELEISIRHFEGNISLMKNENIELRGHSDTLFGQAG